MKRYELWYDDALMEITKHEKPNGEWVRWDDLIAAGVLVPVPDGEAIDMKVINTWDGEPKRTPTQIMRQWYDEYWRDIENYGIAGLPVNALMAALAPLFAAGPWRADVENAPRDGIELLIWYETEDNGHQVRIVHWYEPFKNFRDRMDYGIWPPAFKAFATINRPETPNA